MKKLIFILAFAIAAININAQAATFSFKKKSKTIRTITTDYTITNTTTSWFQWNGAKDYATTHDYQCILDSASGDHTSIAVSLYGRKFSGSSWVQIGSTSTSTAGTDTVTISNIVHGRYRQFKSSFTAVGTGTTTINEQVLKLWLE